MTNKALGQALLDLDSAQLGGVADMRRETWRVLERDRRRVWWLTAVTIGFWAVAVLMVLWMLVAFGLLMPLQAKLRDDAQHGRLSPEAREMAEHKAQILFQMITVGVTASVGVLAFAALATVFLVLVSRRATLRQVNANLLEISEQLKALRQAATGPPPV